MVQEPLSQIKTQMKKAVLHLAGQVNTVRTGRAHAALVEGITVTYYGSSVPLKQIATIQVPDASLVIIQPWDPKSISDIEQGIRQSHLGIEPSNDGRTVRLVIPPLTTERRGELVKLLHKMGEEARVALRSIRKEAWDSVQRDYKDGAMTEDDKYRTEEQLNKIIDEFNAEVDDIIKQKEADILTV